MAAWPEIERVRKDAAAARRRIAQTLLLLRRDQIDFTDWEVDFLDSMIAPNGREELTTRQAEKLLEIRDGAEQITEFRGLSIKILLQKCYEARLDLDEGDEQWIVALRNRSHTTVRRKHAGRLMACARRLYLIDEGVDA